MNTLLLRTQDDQRFFTPGDPVDGTASWQLIHHPAWVQARLYWATRGKGDTDTKTIATQRFENPQPTDSRPFRFTLPRSPHSFSGSLISVVWALELTAEATPDKFDLSIVVSPTASEILLHRDEPGS